MRETTRALLLCLFCLALAPLIAADPGETERAAPLPIHLTEEEKTRLDEIGRDHRSTASPTGVLRNPAEWEPSQGVLVRWPLGIPVGLVAEMSEDVVVTTIVEDAQDQQAAQSAYSSGGVNMANVEFLFAPTNSIWIRDYGPWFIFENHKLAIVDHIYNRPRPQDDVIPQAIGSAWGLGVYGMDLVHTGGNHMSDGLGMSASTELVTLENPTLTPTEIEQTMQEYLGNDYTVLDYIQSGGIHHIDCWAKFLGPSTVMVKDVAPTDPTHDELDARAEFLSQQISPWGVPYDVVRIYCPPGTYYTNSLILNDKILVPLFGSSEDGLALQTYQNAMPGYEVLGFEGSWASEDALHCRAMGVPDRGMLFIHHVPFRTEDITQGDYELAATIVTSSRRPLIEDELWIHYSVDGGSWQSVPLSAQAAPNSYHAFVPAQPEDSTVDYYLEAADESGRIETHPYIGAAWAHRFVTICPNHPLVDVTPDATATICSGSERLLTATLDGGGGPFTYQWTEDGVEISGASSATYSALNTGSHIYNCRVRGDGCSLARTDVDDVVLTWQTEPGFDGLSAVSDLQTPTCTLELSWAPATAPCGGPVHYEVYRSSTPGFAPGPENLLVTGLAATSHGDSAGLISGTTYHYVVRARDEGNAIADANTVELSAAPSGPGGAACAAGGVPAVATVPDGTEGGTAPLLAARQANGISLSWDAATTDCASSGYHLVWGRGSDIASYTVSGSDCTLDASGSHLWTTGPDVSSDWSWFLVLGNDGATEGGWGTDSSSIPRSAYPSGECGTDSISPAACVP